MVKQYLIFIAFSDWMSWPTLLKLSVKVPRKALKKTVQATGVLKNIY